MRRIFESQSDWFGRGSLVYEVLESVLHDLYDHIEETLGEIISDSDESLVLKDTDIEKGIVVQRYDGGRIQMGA